MEKWLHTVQISISKIEQLQTELVFFSSTPLVKQIITASYLIACPENVVALLDYKQYEPHKGKSNILCFPPVTAKVLSCRGTVTAHYTLRIGLQGNAFGRFEGFSLGVICLDKPHRALKM